MRLICLLTVSLLTQACGTRPMNMPPIAKQVPYTHEMHGHQRPDPWFWLRDDDRNDPEMLAYLKAENTYAKAVLAPTEALQKELFEELKGRLKKDDSTVPVLKRGSWYYARYVPEGEYPVYCRRVGAMTAPEEIILDVNALAKPHAYYAVGGLAVSENQQLLAYTEDTVSRRQYTLKIKDLRTGELFADAIPDTSGEVAWAADDRTLFYVKKDPTTLRAHQVWRHTLGTAADADVLVFDEKDEAFSVSVERERSRRFVEIESYSTLVTETLVLEASDPQGEFRPILPRGKDHEYTAWHMGDFFYIRTNEGTGGQPATNFRLVKAPVATAADRSTWTQVIPHRSDVWLGAIALFDQYLVVEERRNALLDLRAIRWADGESIALPADEPVFTASLGDNPELGTSKVRYLYSSLRTPNSVYEYDLATGERTLLKRDEVLGGFDPANYVVERVWSPARDGVQIPVSVVRRTTTKVDGQAPLYVYGYGSYGYSMDPDFSAPWLSLLDRGFIVAVAHIRGGQEMGRTWYDDGKMFKKINTFNDFIDATEHLVKQGYGAKDKVFAEGGSAGGLLMGAVINMRPDLYRAVHAAVPFVDVVSTMLDESIPLTTGEYDEWGNPNEKASYDYMLSYSPYDNVKAQAYPHLLVTTGLHDSQVQYWEPAKWVARLRATKTDTNHLLFDTDLETGHGGASGRYKRFERTALVYAFFLHVLATTGQQAE